MENIREYREYMARLGVYIGKNDKIVYMLPNTV